MCLNVFRHDNVDIHAALILAATMFVGGLAWGYLSNQLNEHCLHPAFGGFICGLGIDITFGAISHLGWI